MEKYKCKKNEARIPSRGDFLESDSGSVCVVSHVQHGYVIEIVGIINGELTYEEDGAFFDEIKDMYPASGKAIAKLSSTLHESGKVYNPVTMQVEDIKQEFKRGDVLTCERGHTCVFDRLNEINNGFFHEIVAVINNDITRSNDCVFGITKDYRHATPEEAQRLWDALAKEGKRWNPETMEVEEIKKYRWRAERGEKYYCLDKDVDIVIYTDDGDNADNNFYELGNYFRTEEQAEKARPYIQKAFDEFWKEELNKNKI